MPGLCSGDELAGSEEWKKGVVPQVRKRVLGKDIQDFGGCAKEFVFSSKKNTLQCFKKTGETICLGC